MQERRREGLCYNCDEQYVHGHKCPRLFYLEVTDFVDDESAPTDVQQLHLLDDTPLISLHAITGLKTAETMQVWVRIGTQ